MKATFWSMTWLLPGVALSFSFASVPQSGRRLWVLQEPSQVVEYDPSTWAVINSIKVPVEFMKDPDSLQINRNGQMLFCADPQIQWGNLEQHFPADKVWLWNSQSAVILDRFPGEKGTPAARKNATVENSRRWALSSNGRHLYWFENEFRIVRNADRVDKAVLVGHSMGAPVALTFLSKFPEKVKALVIVDGFVPMPPASKEEEKKREAEAAEEMKSYRSSDYKAIVGSDIDSMFSPQASQDLREEIRSKMLSTPQHVLASAMEGMWALAPLKTKAEKPTLAIMDGRNLSPSFEQYMREMVLNLEIHKWDDTGHFLMMEQPERFNRALLDFLRKLRRYHG